MTLSVFDDVWDAFIQGDHISQASIWGGEGLALIAPIEAAQTLKGLVEIQARLASALPFQAHLPETLHITVRLFGKPDEVQASRLAAYLRSALEPVPTFFVDLKRVSSFFRAPFMEIHDQGALDSIQVRIRPGLAALGFQDIDYGPRGQVWHVTLGAYTQSNDGAAARSLLRELRGCQVKSFLVNRLRLVRTSPGAPYRMQMVEEFGLKPLA